MNRTFLKDNYIHLCGIILIKFYIAWLLQFYQVYHNEGLYEVWSLEYDVLPISTRDIEKSRVLIYLLKYILDIGYWGFFTIHILFCVSFYYVGIQCNVKKEYILLSLLGLPVFVYGAWGFGVWATDSLAYLVMVWMYYFYRTRKMSMYYVFSVIGFLTREFCLYVNIFFVIEFFVVQYNEKKWNIKTYDVMKMGFEYVLIGGYFVFRYLMVSTHSDYFPMFKSGTLIDDFTNVKHLMKLPLIFGFLSIPIAKERKKEHILILLVVVFFTFFAGVIFELNKVGCLCVVFALDCNVLKHHTS